jgi:hypothetical protein
MFFVLSHIDIVKFMRISHYGGWLVPCRIFTLRGARRKHEYATKWLAIWYSILRQSHHFTPCRAKIRQNVEFVVFWCFRPTLSGATIQHGRNSFYDSLFWFNTQLMKSIFSLTELFSFIFIFNGCTVSVFVNIFL